MFEARSHRPAIKWAGRARFPDGDLVTFTELRGRVPIQLEDLCQRRAGIRTHRGIAGCRRRHLCDAAHADGMMVPAAQERRSRWRADRGGVEAGVFQSLCSEPLGRRSIARPTEGARCAEADLVEQNDEHVRCSRRRTQRADRRKLRCGILGVIEHRARVGPVRNRQHVASDVIGGRHSSTCLKSGSIHMHRPSALPAVASHGIPWGRPHGTRKIFEEIAPRP